MAAEKKSNWARNVVLVVIAITIGAIIGSKVYEISKTVDALEVALYGPAKTASTAHGFQLRDDYSPVEDARRSHLQSLVSFEQERLTNWAGGFIAYVIGALLFLTFLIFVSPRYYIGSPRLEDYEAFFDIGRKAGAKVTTAASSVKRAIPRQPTVAGLSAADELRKWEELRKEGLVTDEEFKRMRDKLVG
ncbi:SHOCT domain-containing protein [Brevundimonas sp. M1A4_2e]